MMRRMVRLLVASVALLLPGMGAAQPFSPPGIQAAQSDGTPVQQCMQVQADDGATQWTGCQLGAGPTAITGTGGCLDGSQTCAAGYSAQSGTPHNFSLGGAFRIREGTSPPATCTTGEVYLETDVAPPLRHLLCRTTNTWIRTGALYTLTAYTNNLKQYTADTQRFGLIGKSPSRVCSSPTSRLCMVDNDCYASQTCPTGTGTGNATFALTRMALQGVTIWAAWCNIQTAHLNSGTRTLTLEDNSGDTAVSMVFGNTDGFKSFTSTTGVSCCNGGVAAWKSTVQTANALTATEATCTLLLSHDSVAVP